MSNTTNGAPTLSQLEQLAEFCSKQEWQELSSSSGFIAAVCSNVSDTEAFMSYRLGRKISLSQPSVKNPGDESL